MDDGGFVINLWGSCWGRAIIGLIGVAIVAKIFLPLRCKRCRRRVVTMQDEISQRTIKRCLKCGHIEDIQDGADDYE